MRDSGASARAPVMPYCCARTSAFAAPPYVQAAAEQPAIDGYAPTVV